MIEKIEPAAAIRLLDAGKATAVDVREPDEFAVGHIPGAKLLPLGEVLSRAAEVLPDKNAPWLIYCRTGRRSADAVQKLDSLGYTNLYDLGGILSWPYEIEGDLRTLLKLYPLRAKRVPESARYFRSAGGTNQGLLAPGNPKAVGLHTKNPSRSAKGFFVFHRF